jgi:hypothetical protein
MLKECPFTHCLFVAEAADGGYNETQKGICLSFKLSNLSCIF